MKLLVFACLIAYVSAHACLVFPRQWGGYPGNTLNTKGDDACGLTTAGCGGVRDPKDYIITFKGGEKYNVTFQKNLDHFYKEAPGYWALAFWQGEKMISSALNISDPSPDKVGSLDFVTAPIMMPKKKTGIDLRDDANTYVLQLSYGTNNPELKKAVFYQCTTIMVM